MEDESLPASGCLTSCLYMLGLTLAASLMLVINGGITYAIFVALAESNPAWLADERPVQFVLFISPVGLLVLQWMLLDMLVRIVRRGR